MPVFKSLARMFRAKVESGPRILKTPTTSSPIMVLLKRFSLITRRRLTLASSQNLLRGFSLHHFVGVHWWSGRLRLFLSFLLRTIVARQRHILGVTAFTASSASAATSSPTFDWNASRISDAVIKSHQKDLNYIKMLKENTLTCRTCHKRHTIEGGADKNVVYCSCPEKKTSVYGVSSPGVSWTPFLERDDILIWRQEHPPGSGLYAYKMYGHFSDVTPREFIEVQLDMSAYRLSWDASTAQVHVIEEETTPSNNSLSQIYYWEVNWPRFFSNRDYVCNRRSQVFEEANVAVLYTKSTSHPSAPKKSKNVRVEDYSSVLTVRPLVDGGWDEPGLEFSLTAYENPGVSLPASVTTWVVMRGMPEFMNNLRKACLELRGWKHPLPNSVVSREPAYLSTKQATPCCASGAKRESEPFVNVQVNMNQ